MAPNLALPVAAVCARAVPAGTIDSRNGSAIDTPTPRRNVRRDRCILLMNISALRELTTSKFSVVSCNLLLLHSHLERITRHHAKDQRRESVVVLRSTSNDGTNRRHVEVLYGPSQRIREQLLGDVGHERIGSREQSSAKIARPLDDGAVHQLT